MSFYRIRPRAGTATQWELVNPVLGEREIGFEVPESGVGSGNVKMKMGDGVTTWNELPYAILAGIAPEDIVHNGETNDPNKIVGADAFYSLFQNVATLDTEVDTLTDSLSTVNKKLYLPTISRVGFAPHTSGDYIDISFGSYPTDATLYIFRIWITSSKLTLYKSTNGGQSYENMWDKTLA